MKHFLFIPFFLITSYCFSQSSKNIIGKPIKIDNFFVAQKDFPKEMNWDNAMRACRALGAGWRLPTIDELKAISTNKDKIGGFISPKGSRQYWSSTEDPDYDGYASMWDLDDERWPSRKNMRLTYYVRAVKSL